jgi:hypothetical protein
VATRGAGQVEAKDLDDALVAEGLD